MLFCSEFLKIIVSISLAFLEKIVNNSTSKYGEKPRMYNMKIGDFTNFCVMKIIIRLNLMEVIIQVKNSYWVCLDGFDINGNVSGIEIVLLAAVYMNRFEKEVLNSQTQSLMLKIDVMFPVGNEILYTMWALVKCFSNNFIFDIVN